MLNLVLQTLSFPKVSIILEDFLIMHKVLPPHSLIRVIQISLTAPSAKTFDMKFESWLKNGYHS